MLKPEEVRIDFKVSSCSEKLIGADFRPALVAFSRRTVLKKDETRDTLSVKELAQEK